jgi:hypothetical protein
MREAITSNPMRFEAVRDFQRHSETHSDGNQMAH